jgi:predicted amidohydrolase YtcJ
MKMHCDVVILGGNVITIDPERPRAQAVAVKFGRILAIGKDDELKLLVGANTKVVDARGMTVLPGFIDAHCHPLDAGRRALLRANCGPAEAPSIADAKRVLAERAHATPAGQWVLGYGYDEAKLPEGRLLTRADLDEVTVDHPVFVEHSSGHIGMLNSRGLERGNLTRDSADPEGGTYGRDTAGELDGCVFETGQDKFIGRGAHVGRGLIPAPTPEDDRRALEFVTSQAASLGITGYHEMLADPTMLKTYQAARNNGELGVRVSAYIYVDYLDAIVNAGLQSGFGDSLLRIGGAKLLGDGALSGRTAFLWEPYEGRSDYFGVQGAVPDVMEAQVLEAHRAGLQVGIHANGDRFIGMVLDSYEKALEVVPRCDHRLRIEHCSVMNPQLLGRMQRLGVMAIPFGSYIYYHGEKMGSYGSKRLEMMLPHRSFLDAGIPIAGSSDYPCGPWNPLIGIQSCVTRKSRAGEEIGPGQRITPEEALRVYTLGGAYASFEENDKGSIKVGKLADFVLLGGDPTSAEPDSIAEIPVVATMLGGEVVYRNR